MGGDITRHREKSVFVISRTWAWSNFLYFIFNYQVGLDSKAIVVNCSPEIRNPKHEIRNGSADARLLINACGRGIYPGRF